jgi:hypothetical protein
MVPVPQGPAQRKMLDILRKESGDKLCPEPVALLEGLLTEDAP